MKKDVVLITGTSSGFGLLSSIELARKGYQVIASMRNSDRETPLHTLIQREGLSTIEIIEMDVTNDEEINDKIQGVIDRYGEINVLVNNAGYAQVGFVEEVELAEYRKQFETNFFGLVAVTKAVLPFMRGQKSGKIINISSVSGRIGFPILSPYVSSKFAVEGFSECLRLEALPYGIYVTLIEPGPYKTKIWEKGGIHPSENTQFNQNMLTFILQEIEKIADQASDPQEVVNLLVQIVEARYPKLRYLVGKGMKRQTFIRNLVPRKWIEQLMLRRIKDKK